MSHPAGWIGLSAHSGQNQYWTGCGTLRRVVEIPRLLSGRYRLIEQIGEVGMSPVWLAYDEVLRRRVAVRLLPAELRDEGKLRAAVQSVALLSHPSLSAVYDCGLASDEPFVVMELVEGG